MSISKKQHILGTEIKTTTSTKRNNSCAIKKIKDETEIKANETSMSVNEQLSQINRSHRKMIL